MLTTRIVSDQAGLLSLKGQWGELLAKSNSDSPFLTWEWISNWWTIMRQEDQELFVICVLAQSGELLGIVPFLRRVHRDWGIPVAILEFIGGDHNTCADYMDIIVSHRDLDAVSDCVLRYLHGDGAENWDVILMSGMSQRGNFRALLDRCAAKEYEIHEDLLDGCPYITLPEKWEDYLGGLSKKSRYNVGKKRRNLDQVCENRFYLVSEGDDLSGTLAGTCELQKKRLEMKGLTTCARFFEFQSTVAKEFLRKGWLFLGVLEANEKAVASQYAFRWRDKIFHYQTGFDPEYERYSVGLISTGLMIEAAIRENLREYDFLRGREDYKYHWAKEERPIIFCQISNKNYRGRFFMRTNRLIAVVKERAKRLLRKDP